MDDSVHPIYHHQADVSLSDLTGDAKLDHSVNVVTSRPPYHTDASFSL